MRDSPSLPDLTSTSALTLFSQSFPFTPLGTPPDVQEMIERQHLPEEERALGYCKVYFEQVAWLFRGLTRGQVVAEMLPAIYKRVRRTSPAGNGNGNVGADANGNGSGAGETGLGGGVNADGEGLDEEEWAGPHDLALLFMVFAIGALVGGPTDAPIPGSATTSTHTPLHSGYQPSPLNQSTSSSSYDDEPVQGDGGGKAGGGVHILASNPPLAEHFYQIARACLSLQPVLEKPSIVTIQSLHVRGSLFFFLLQLSEEEG
jgi:hypothetical protein